MSNCPYCNADLALMQGHKHGTLYQCGTFLLHGTMRGDIGEDCMAGVLAREAKEKESRDRLWEQVQYYERTRRCHSPYAKRPILYTDTVNGEQCCVDNLWAVSTEELNESARLQAECNKYEAEAIREVVAKAAIVDRLHVAEAEVGRLRQQERILKRLATLCRAMPFSDTQQGHGQEDEYERILEYVDPEEGWPSEVLP